MGRPGQDRIDAGGWPNVDSCPGTTGSGLFGWSENLAVKGTAKASVAEGILREVEA